MQDITYQAPRNIRLQGGTTHDLSRRGLEMHPLLSLPLIFEIIGLTKANGPDSQTVEQASDILSRREKGKLTSEERSLLRAAIGALRKSQESS